MMTDTVVMMKRVTERQAADAVVAYLRDKGGRRRSATYDELKFCLPNKYLTLSDADREQQRHRGGDLKWHAALRNIAAHAGQPGNAVTEGRLIKLTGGGFALPRDTE
jgi:hypothetical protein